MPLTDIAVRTAKPKDKQYKLSDSVGLYLLVTPSGSKCWKLKYRFAGKEKMLSMGMYPIITLAEARERTLQAKKQLANNIDPSQAKKDAKIQAAAASENTFKSLTLEWHETQKQKWKPRHADAIIRLMERNAFPTLGHRAISEIKAQELLATIRIAEGREALDIAHRVLQICSRVFRYAIMTGKAERDISADLRGALKTRKKEHHRSLEAKELPEFLSKLESYYGDVQTKLAIKLILLTFVRTGELRGAKWEEFDWDSKCWRIPAERMKMGIQHIVHLSTQALAVLSELKTLTGNNEYLFPNSNRPTTFISENTMLYAIYRMGYHSRATIHGFRATASTILNEHGFNSDVIEKQLAHAERNSVRAAYDHSNLLPQRRAMLDWWGNYIESAANGKVINVNFGVLA